MASILVAEDDKSVFTLIETNLLTKGHDVLGAHSGAEVIEVLDKTTPSLIVLDIMLPDADGFELLEHIRTRPETERVPVLILTARSDERDRVRALAAGADDYMAKPFFSTELLLRIDRLVNTAATGSALRKLALTDQVTGLGNRSSFEMRLEQLRARVEQEDLDLSIFVIDLPGLPEQVRKTGWKTADMVLGKLGSALRETLRRDEEAFWLFTQFTVTSLEIESGARARSRLDEIKNVVKATLDTFRRQFAVIPYFGYCFYEPPETVRDLSDKILRAPYGAPPVDPPRRSQSSSSQSSIEAAFGGKLTGLAPVDYVPEEPARRRRRTGEQKIGPRFVISQMRSVTEPPADATTGSAGKDPGRSGVGLKKAEPSPAPVLPRLDESRVASGLAEILDEASRDPHDVAVCCLAFDGAEEGRSGLGAESLDALLDEVASQTALEVGLDRYVGAQVFWTGDNVFVAVPSASVADARALARSLREIASSKLSPLRPNLEISPAAGYVFCDFDETAADVIARAKDSPYKGGVLVTPLQARKRAES